MFNTKYNADLVITNHLDGYVIWEKDEVIANTDTKGMSLIVAGAEACGLSVYSADGGKWIVCTVDQLAPI